MWIAAFAAFVVFYTAYFLPTVSRGALLAPGDGVLYYLPFFLAPLQVWSPLILSGYGVLGDPQAQTLYPFRMLTPTFNMFVASAYVIAALGTFGLALRLTHSRLAALCAALVMSGSGFMLAHLGHVSIVHAAAWVPWVLWACVDVSASDALRPVALGGIAVALSLLGGHPQATMMGLLLAGAFALYAIVLRWHARGPRAAGILALRFFGMFALGFMLAAPMVVPSAQAAADSVRSAWTKQDFDSHRHIPESLRMLVFPNLYGAITEGPYGGFRGPGSPTELAIYVGILPLFLAMVAIGDRAKRVAVWFWVGAFAAGFVLMLGTLTPLGELLYRTPILGRFRAQARFGLVTTIALAVLAAYGIAALLRGPPSPARARGMILMAAALCMMFVLSVAFFRPSFGEVPAKPWTHPALWTAPLFMLLALAAFAFLLKRPGRTSACVAIVVATIDVGSFSWFYQWRYVPATDRPVELVTDAAHLVSQLSSGEGRTFPIDAATMSLNPLRPNLNLAYGIPSVVGYTPLVPRRYATFTGVDTAGNLPSLASRAALMDVLAIRWLAGEVSAPKSQLLGAGCAVSSTFRRVRVELPAHAQGMLRIVSHTACSAHLGNGAPVATVRVLGGDGASRVVGALRAGMETGEWSYDRADIRAAVQHERSPVAETFPAPGFRGLWFLAEVPVNAPGDRGPLVEIALEEGVTVPLRIQSVAFVNAKTGARQLLAMTPSYPGEEEEFAKPVRFAGMPAIRERTRYRGMVWSVCSARSASTAAIVQDLRTTGDSGSPRFDARREALLETGVTVPALSCREPIELEVRSRGARHWKVATHGKGAALLVVSERYDDGWRAAVDGENVPVLPANGLILGVPVPEGEHVVELWYLPRYFYLSCAAFLFALLVCGCALVPRAMRMRLVRRIGLA